MERIACALHMRIQASVYTCFHEQNDCGSGRDRDCKCNRDHAFARSNLSHLNVMVTVTVTDRV